MSETHEIADRGRKALEAYLKRSGRSFEVSQNKTFDLIVDGRNAELKSKQLPWGRLDFVGLTDNQRCAIDEGNHFTLFIICNLKGEEAEIIEIPSEQLVNAKWKVECTHYLYGSELKRIKSLA
jgi:hypothetical protein